MASKEEKISALTNLMVNGVLTAEEFSRIIAVLDGSKAMEPKKEKSPAEQAYEDYITKTVATVFKSPSSIKFPPFDASMVKEGTIKLDMRETTCKYIETYVDAPNSYGTMLREDIIIGIDDDFNMLWWAQHVRLGTLLGKSKSWMKMSK